LTGNCNPRLPAAHFQVKKDGPNKGKWFYTCQESKEARCGFFLWDEKAAGREMRAVMENTRSESDASRAPADTARDKMTIEGHSAASNKFMADLAKADANEFRDWGLSQKEEKTLVKEVERADAAEFPDTPRKSIKTLEFATPGSKRKRDEATLPTPVSELQNRNIDTQSTMRDEDVFHTPQSRLKGGMWDGNVRFGLHSPSSTPTPSRFQDATATGGTASQRYRPNYDLTDEVLDILNNQNIDEETTSNLRALLSKHAVRVSGISKGRDITRVAVQTRDAKIVELQQKIASLEAERAMDKTIIKHLRADMTHSVENGRSRGPGRGRGTP
jgi:hypothetical protein